MIFANTGPSEDPIETLSVCSYNWLSNENVVLLQQLKFSFFKVRLLKVVLNNLSLKILSKTILTVRDNGTLVNNDATSKETN